MDTSKQVNDAEDQLSVRVGRFQRKLDTLLKTDNLAELLYLDRDLSRSDIDDKFMNLCYQVAIRKVAEGICDGDAKFIELFWKRYDQYASQRRPEQLQDDAQPAPYVKPNRDGTPKG